MMRGVSFLLKGSFGSNEKISTSLIKMNRFSTMKNKPTTSSTTSTTSNLSKYKQQQSIFNKNENNTSMTNLSKQGGGLYSSLFLQSIRRNFSSEKDQKQQQQSQNKQTQNENKQTQSNSSTTEQPKTEGESTESNAPKIYPPKPPPEYIPRKRTLMEKLFSPLRILLFSLGATVCVYFWYREGVPYSDRKRIIIPLKKWEEKEASQIWEKVKDQYRPYFEAETTPNSRFVRKVANKLLDAAGLEKSEWEIVVIDSPEVNAYILPGCKKIVVFKDLLTMAQNENGLSVVLAHEIAHVLSRHHSEMISREIVRYPLKLARMWSMSQEERTTYLVKEVLGAYQFGKSLELEADAIGLILMAKACYDPEGAIELWERYNTVRNTQGNKGYFIMHPPPEFRILELKKQLPRALSMFKSCPNSNKTLAEVIKTNVSLDHREADVEYEPTHHHDKEDQLLHLKIDHIKKMQGYEWEPLDQRKYPVSSGHPNFNKKNS